MTGKRIAGAILLLVSAISFLSKYFVAAIYGSNVASWDTSSFQTLLSYVKGPYEVIGIIALLGGIVFFVSAAVQEYRKN